jgi:periplasmic protein TonB
VKGVAGVFESFVKQGGAEVRSRRWKRLTFVASFAVHAVLVIAATAHSFWHVDELTPPAISVTFRTATTPPPPPPPPPAAIARPEPRPSVKKPREKPPSIVQPAPVLVQPPAPVLAAPAPAAEAEVAHEEESEPAGEAAGVPGGVVGGVAAPQPPRPAAPPPSAPITIAPSVGSALCLTDLTDSRFRPSLPAAINRPGMSVWGVFKICVSALGHVVKVTLIKSADPLVDNDWMAKMRTWKYRPYSVGGRPVPFCHPARIVVNSA